MKEIKCPKCGTAISVSDADFADILNQVRKEAVEDEVRRRLAVEADLRQAREAQKDAEVAARHRDVLSAKDQEITALKQRIEGWEQNKDLQMEALRLQSQKDVADAVAVKDEEIRKKDAEINRLVTAAAAERENVAEREQALTARYQAEQEALEKEIDLYKNFKAKRSVKLLGEDLEQHCYALYNQLLLPVMPGATFKKDNESVRGEGEDSGTKGDFIFRLQEDGVDVVSIMFEMKNESDVSATRHRNADFYAKLDGDRRKKGCEYAVLVSMLELENEGFSGINVIPGYEKMYMVRPDQFIPIITLLVQAGKNSLEARRQLVEARNRDMDLTNFENQLDAFRDAFGKNVVNAKKKYDEAIEGIDKTIKTMEAIKKALQVSAGHLDAAGNKVEGLTIKKLTRGNATVKAILDEARAKKAEEGPEEQ